ncbi:hypothetical protein F5884DRAFT_221565 [Xylogone sp. PMI_703]|nr:hypothetical protein F5884DRAFT_221565 [Xylogone sp. PMI_703]
MPLLFWREMTIMAIQMEMALSSLLSASQLCFPECPVSSTDTVLYILFTTYPCSLNTVQYRVTVNIALLCATCMLLSTAVTSIPLRPQDVQTALCFSLLRLPGSRSWPKLACSSHSVWSSPQTIAFFKLQYNNCWLIALTTGNHLTFWAVSRTSFLSQRRERPSQLAAPDDDLRRMTSLGKNEGGRRRQSCPNGKKHLCLPTAYVW